MKRFFCLVFPWLVLLAACSNDTQAARKRATDRFASLVAYLDRDTDLIVLADLHEAGALFEQMLADVEEIPLVARTPELLDLWKMQRAMFEGMLAAAKEKAGFDFMRDLGSAVIGIRLRQGVDPDMTLLANGKFPEDLPQKIEPGASRRELDGAEVWELGGGMAATMVGKETLLITRMAKISQVLGSGKTGGEPPVRHPDLMSPVKKDFLLRFSFAVPDWLRILGERPQPGASILKGLEYVLFDIGRDSLLAVKTTGEKARENVEYLLRGAKEILVGGPHVARAYAFFVLGLDLGELPDMPLPLKSALSNRQAIKETVDQLLGPLAKEPKVTVSGNKVTLLIPREAMMGNAFMIGTLAAVAIPAFITYLRRSKATEAEYNLVLLQTLEESYFVETGSYMACGPVPEHPPGGDPVSWPGDECFAKLGFNPQEDLYCNYQTALVGEKGYLLRAACDLDSDGNPMVWVIKPGDNLPKRVSPPDVW